MKSQLPKFSSHKYFPLLAIAFILLFILLGVLFISNYLVKIKNKIEVTYKTINLNPVDEIKTVIYESEYVILTFNYSDVINYLNEVKYNSQESKNIKQYIEEQGLTTNEIIISEISIYYIGDLIELSTVKVYDKVSDRYVEEVEVEERHIHCGPMCESGQKHYRIQHDKDPFLSIPTWIS